MSRVGKNEIKVPSSIQMKIDGQSISFKGKGAEENYLVPDQLKIETTEGGFKVSPAKTLDRVTRSFWGTTQRNLANIVKGLSDGFSTKVNLVGVGYRASAAGKTLTLQLGYSHDIKVDIPASVTVKMEGQTGIQLNGSDKAELGQFVAYLKSLRPVEPYKGKGVIKEGDYVLRKEGKKK